MVQLSIIQVNINRMMLVTETSNIARNQLAATFRWLTEVEESLGSFINGGSNGGGGGVIENLSSIADQLMEGLQFAGEDRW